MFFFFFFGKWEEYVYQFYLLLSRNSYVVQRHVLTESRMINCTPEQNTMLPQGCGGRHWDGLEFSVRIQTFQSSVFCCQLYLDFLSFLYCEMNNNTLSQGYHEDYMLMCIKLTHNQCPIHDLYIKFIFLSSIQLSAMKIATLYTE